MNLCSHIDTFSTINFQTVLEEAHFKSRIHYIVMTLHCKN